MKSRQIGGRLERRQDGGFPSQRMKSRQIEAPPRWRLSQSVETRQIGGRLKRRQDGGFPSQ
jgi:hypothetical protein